MRWFLFPLLIAASLYAETEVALKPYPARKKSARCQTPSPNPCPESCPEPCPAPCPELCPEPCQAPCPKPCFNPCIDNGYLYLEAFGGANFLSNFTQDGVTTAFETGYAFSGSLGCSYYYGFRLEAEFAYRRNTIDTIEFFGRAFSIPGHYQCTSWMGNLLWELPLDRWLCRRISLKPIIGGGLGYDDQHIHGDLGILTYTVVEKGFAWQVMAGLVYRALNCVDISVDYKCHEGRMDSLFNHSIGLALNYHFYSW